MKCDRYAQQVDFSGHLKKTKMQVFEVRKWWEELRLCLNGRLRKDMKEGANDGALLIFFSKFIKADKGNSFW